MSEELPEFEDEKVTTENTEAEVVYSADGSVSHSTVTVGGYPSRGGMISSPGFAPYPALSPSPVPGTVYPGTTWTTTTTGPWAAPKKKAKVKLPADFSEKVLLAFMNPDKAGEDDEVEWSAILPLIKAELAWEDGEQILTLTFSMEDEYGNTED